jgi:hypothetical protein
VCVVISSKRPKEWVWCGVESYYVPYLVWSVSVRREAVKDGAPSRDRHYSSLASKMEKPSSSRLTCRSAPKAPAPPLVDDVCRTTFCRAVWYSPTRALLAVMDRARCRGF